MPELNKVSRMLTKSKNKSSDTKNTVNYHINHITSKSCGYFLLSFLLTSALIHLGSHKKSMGIFPNKPKQKYHDNNGDQMFDCDTVSILSIFIVRKHIRWKCDDICASDYVYIDK